MNILLCGYGNIGKELHPTFCKFGYVSIFDPKYQYSISEQELVATFYDVAFICVPTETINGKCDCSIVEQMCQIIKANVIVIKSTVSVGETEHIYNNINDRVIFSPEFTSTNQHKGIQNFVVLGGERKLCNKVAQLYMNIYPADFRIIYTDSKTAEMSKYMLNCFLALKVTFCKEISQACNTLGIEYDDVRNIFIQDSRINPSHTFVYNDKPYYDSHCLNKDIPAFNSQFNLPLMKFVEQVNKSAKEQEKNV